MTDRHSLDQNNTFDDETRHIDPADTTRRPSRHPAPGSARADIAAVRPKPPVDKCIWGVYGILVFISLVELYSASSREITSGNIFGPLLRHALLLSVGFICMVSLQRIHYKYYFKWTYLIVALSIAATIYTMFFGSIINGARRSFSLLGISVQPSELIKLSAAMLIARVLSQNQLKGKNDVTRKGVIIVAVSVLIFSALLVNQGLTNTLLLMAISVSMMIVGGVGARKFFIVMGIYLGLALCYGGYKYIKASVTEQTPVEAVESDNSHTTDRTNLRMERIKNYFGDKVNDTITSENQQEQYSYIAQANGGLFGVMPGNSRETARLPLAFSDYIYAIIIEDGGLISGLFVMMLYLCLLFRAGYIAARCKKAYPAFLVLGMALYIVFQALFHMAIVTGFFPVSGQPLPLISKGGSSVIITSVALGIMLSVSRFAIRKGKRQAVRDELTPLNDNTVNPDDTDNPSRL